MGRQLHPLTDELSHDGMAGLLEVKLQRMCLGDSRLHIDRMYDTNQKGTEGLCYAYNIILTGRIAGKCSALCIY